MKARRFLSLLTIALLVAAGACVFRETRLAYRGWQQPVIVEIAPGTPSRAIAARLRELGVLRREWPFLALHYGGRGKTLKAGEYGFDQPLSPSQVIEKLRRGDVYYQALTIPEGFNIFEIAEAVAGSPAARGALEKDAVLAALRDPALIAGLDPAATSLEGYLFPDTYHFTGRASPPQIARAMVSRFRQVYRELEARHPAPRSLHDVVVMASLVEEETGVPGERPLVAGVFYNRLAANLPLQCDPTVAYAALLNGRYRGTIFHSDLQYDSPYNTYKRPGLPPGPIANPSRASLEAALAPAATKHLYFVSNAEGGHVFSESLRDHSRAVGQYRRKTR